MIEGPEHTDEPIPRNFSSMTHTRIVKVEVQSTSGVQIKLMKADDAFAATAGPRLTEPLVGRDSPLLSACGGRALPGGYEDEFVKLGDAWQGLSGTTADPSHELRCSLVPWSVSPQEAFERTAKTA